MDAIATFQKDNIQVSIHYDDTVESPREWENLGTMALFHKKYKVSNEDDLTIQQSIKIYNSDDYICLPVYMYDHSGISLSTSNEMYPFNDVWDAGQLGIIFVRKDKVRKEFGVKRISSALKQRIIANLKAEVEAYGQFLNGDVFVVDRLEDGEITDSCGGFFGFLAAEEYAKDLLED
jgi:hypothetical protein